LSRKEQIERYAVTGGVPKYIESFADCTHIYEGIEENILNRTGYLYEEPYFLLQQEVAEVGGYFGTARYCIRADEAVGDRVLYGGKGDRPDQNFEDTDRTRSGTAGGACHGGESRKE
jgi:hypothetical protein